MSNVLDSLIPTSASKAKVRESAGETAFSIALCTSPALQALDAILPAVLLCLEDPATFDTALDGLKHLMSQGALPYILPRLFQLPLSEFNVRAFGELAKVAGPALNPFVSNLLPALLSAMGDANENIQNLATKAAETVVMVIDIERIEPLISEFRKGVKDNKASIRRSTSYLIGYFFGHSDLYLVEEVPNMTFGLILLLSDVDSATVPVALEALSNVIDCVPRGLLPNYIELVQGAVFIARRRVEKRKELQGSVLIPGLCLPKSLKPLLPIFLQGLKSSTAEVRVKAALGLRELIEVTNEETLEEFVVPITEPVIQIIDTLFDWQVKSAALSILITIMEKGGGLALKLISPRLQTVFILCLQDYTRFSDQPFSTVRYIAALAFGQLSALLSPRIDPLVNHLLSTFEAFDKGVKSGYLIAFREVIEHSGQSMGAPVRARLLSLLKSLVSHEDWQIHLHALKTLEMGKRCQIWDD